MRRSLHANAVEQEGFFLAVAISYQCIVKDSPKSFWPALLLYIFLGARVVHMFAYLMKLQPFRTLAFLVGCGVQTFLEYLTSHMYVNDCLIGRVACSVWLAVLLFINGVLKWHAH